jgi:hypothetical protein
LRLEAYCILSSVVYDDDDDDDDDDDEGSVRIVSCGGRMKNDVFK